MSERIDSWYTLEGANSISGSREMCEPIKSSGIGQLNGILYDADGNEVIQLDRLREFAEAEREGKIKIGPDWTPCSVALPEAGKQVLVTAQWGDEEPEVFSADMNPITDAWEHSDGEEISRAYTVLAWQPLPEPYRGEA